MIIAEGHADGFVQMETTIGRHHEDFGRIKRVGSREFEHTVVNSTLIRAIGKSKDDEVPD